MSDTEFRYCELRFDQATPRRLSGVAVVYNQFEDLGTGHREKILAGRISVT